MTKPFWKKPYISEKICTIRIYKKFVQSVHKIPHTLHNFFLKNPYNPYILEKHPYNSYKKYLDFEKKDFENKKIIKAKKIQFSFLISFIFSWCSKSRNIMYSGLKILKIHTIWDVIRTFSTITIFGKNQKIRTIRTFWPPWVIKIKVKIKIKIKIKV